MRAAVGPNAQIFQAFPLGGPCREVEVGDTWTDLLGNSSIDLVMIRVPDVTKRVVVLSSTEDLAGAPATAEQAAKSWPLDPGTWTFCTDREFGEETLKIAPGPRFYLAIDPRDATAGVADVATIHVLEAAR